MKIVFQPKYILLTAELFNEEGVAVRGEHVVTIPNETMTRLNDRNKYPFYRFLDDEGFDIFFQYDEILRIERKFYE